MCVLRLYCYYCMKCSARTALEKPLVNSVIMDPSLEVDRLTSAPVAFNSPTGYNLLKAHRPMIIAS